MKSRLLVSFFLVSCLASCELLSDLNRAEENPSRNSQASICIWKNAAENSDCNIDYWLRFWSTVEDIDWPERKKRIASLTAKDTDVLKKIMLSQGKSTPYQNRLRAQAWTESLLPKFSKDMRRFILVAIYHPSQDLLEMESALVTLSKVNTYQSENLEEHKLLLQKKQSQLDQLLNIEATIIQSTEEGKQ